MQVSADITGVKTLSRKTAPSPVGKTSSHEHIAAPLHIGCFPKHYILTPLQHVSMHEPSLA